jgi:hypothetical protein
MKVNDKFINIEPYISTSWQEVQAIFLKDESLIIKLKTGELFNIPNLSAEEKTHIFKCHSDFLEKEERAPQPFPSPFPPAFGNMPISFKIGTPEGIVSAVEHLPEMSDAPDLPEEILNKITEATKLLSPQDIGNLPKAQENCNCFYCQIMNRISKAEPPEPELEEIVTEDDLIFQDWKITLAGDKLYTVENPLDSTEKFTVYLGHPVGCTCGQEGCEHIVAVLKS